MADEELIIEIMKVRESVQRMDALAGDAVRQLTDIMSKTLTRLEMLAKAVAKMAELNVVDSSRIFALEGKVAQLEERLDAMA